MSRRRDGKLPAASARTRGGQGATRRRAAQPPRRQPSIWLNRLLVLCAVAVVLGAGTQAWLTLRSIPVQRITVTGELEHTQAAAVEALVKTSLAGGFLGADLQRMRSELEGLPWIFEATVRRRWPNALEIHVVEQLAIARWNADGFLNHEGGVFQSGRAADVDSLPLLRGPRDSAPALMAKYLRLREMLAPLHLTVAELAVDERGQVEAVLGGGVRLVIGGEQFRERMQRFVELYRDELAQRAGEVERVDLRYATGAAVAFREAVPPGDGALAGL